MKRIALAVFDLDNTLYDWYAAFIPAFYEMVDVASEILNCERDQLLDELKLVHVKHQDVEHPFGLFETRLAQTLVGKLGSDHVWKTLDPAFHAYNRVRKQELRLFPDTLETLGALNARGIKLVAYTDSKYHSALGRVQRLALGPFFQRIYCREKAVGETPDKQLDDYKALAHKVVELPATEIKPNPEVLLDIADRESIAMSFVAYIGDSITKDILMAQRAGCFSVWAKYGAFTDQKMYARLIRVSHWTEQDIRREREYAKLAANIVPDFVCERTIAEILSVLQGEESRT